MDIMESGLMGLDLGDADTEAKPAETKKSSTASSSIRVGIDRIAAGKSEAGINKLNAYHKGGNIMIEIIDDGPANA